MGSRNGSNTKISQIDSPWGMCYMTIITLMLQQILLEGPGEDNREGSQRHLKER